MRRLALLAALCCLAAMTAALARGAGPAPQPVWGAPGVLAPDGQTRYVTLPARGSSVLAAIRTSDGTVKRFLTLKGVYGIPAVTIYGVADGLSRDGGTLVLNQAVNGIRAQSTFDLVDTKKLAIKRRLTFKGTYSFDALSPDMRTLFAIQWQSYGPETHYLVRAIDLPSGKLVPHPIADKTEQGPMQGFPSKRAVEQDGRWVYTLYRENDGEHLFVHALDTVGRIAVCIDLPFVDASGTAEKGTFRIEQDGSLVLRDAGGRLLARIVDHKLVSAVKSL